MEKLSPGARTTGAARSGRALERDSHTLSHTLTPTHSLSDSLTRSLSHVFNRGGHYRGGERLTVFGSGFGDTPYSPEVEQPTLNQPSTKVQISTLNAPNNAPPRSNSQPQTLNQSPTLNAPNNTSPRSNAQP